MSIVFPEAFYPDFVFMIFQESGWKFEFDESWQVKKFDDHRYYKTLSGRGFKGIDFIAIQPDRHLLLIEVKNYRDQEPPSSEKMAEIFSKKIEDSLKLINIVRAYYARSWHYRLLEWLIRRKPGFFGEKGFWTEVIELAEQKKSHAILWIDAPLASPNFIPQTQEAIQAKLPDHLSFSIEPYANEAAEMGVRIQCC